MVINSNTTHFGFNEVPIEEKADKVADVFHSVADKYDLMNDLMSLGLHRLWKRFAVDVCNLRAGQKVLDVAGGTGDLSAKFAKIVGPKGQVILSDINSSMLNAGRSKLLDNGIIHPLQFCLANAEKLPFKDNYFDCITIGFGLRNVTNKDTALQSMFRCLKPGGKLVILEFSEIKIKELQPLYDQYSFKILPQLGEQIAGDSESYKYLAESIRMHPNQESLKDMMEQAGFERCDFFNLSGGIVAVHKGYKF